MGVSGNKGLHALVHDAIARVDRLPVHHAVKDLLRNELLHILRSPPPDPDSYAATVLDEFLELRRFPAGPLDFMVSGVRRSWMAKVPVHDLPRTLMFIGSRLGGFAPAFFVHVANTARRRALVIDKEVKRSYYRMARSLMLQPNIRGIVCAAWFHDPAMLREMPQLGALNEPYLQHGGFITTVGAAPEDAGFLERSPERRRRWEAGELKPQLGLAMWPRKAAIAWAEAHTELE